MPATGAAEPTISARVAAISESPTIALDLRVKELRGRGEHVISFAAGEPDFPTPDVAVEAGIRACRDFRAQHYTPPAGLPELRRAVAAKTSRDSGMEVGWEQVLVTNGTKQAVAHAFTLLLEAGDEVLIPAPYWVTFPEAVRLAGGRPVPVPASEASGFRVSVEDLEEHATPRTKALLFVSPSNPTGTVYRREQMEAIGQWARDRGLWVVCDEIYDQFTYDGAEFLSLPAVVPGLRSRAICLNGVAKAYSMTGWRVGWMVAPLEVARAGANLQSHVSGNISNVSQLAATAALEAGLGPVGEMRAAFAARRRTMLRLMEDVPGFECPAPEGAFYLFPSVEGVMGRSVAGEVVSSSRQLAALLLEVAQIAVVPGEAFGAPGHVRLSYALGDADLEDGMSRLRRALA